MRAMITKKIEPVSAVYSEMTAFVVALYAVYNVLRDLDLAQFLRPLESYETLSSILEWVEAHTK